jgi:hypothetical protein
MISPFTLDMNNSPKKSNSTIGEEEKLQPALTKSFSQSASKKDSDPLS